MDSCRCPWLGSAKTLLTGSWMGGMEHFSPLRNGERRMQAFSPPRNGEHGMQAFSPSRNGEHGMQAFSPPRTTGEHALQTFSPPFSPPTTNGRMMQVAPV